ncbi:unnamed protein product [Miscanthus lutarioriparius]|uniref:non-specific serine/threonine protein kinase n=1 Tax=Miscanthus lutarioriparius TaxID=422564 RepID=A0A811SIK3_9POAL|nr:unnamed protein product [Miscanthus lutarioriparius]
MRMQLSDDGGVLKDWKDNQMTPCYWANIDCQDNKVIAITLSSAGLVGILSPSIAKITTLQQLLLDGNAISGRIPEELGNLSSLTTLNLGRNSFNGSIPNSLGGLLKLQNLDLSENTLAGAIPNSLGRLLNLQNLDLSENTLAGTIPISFSNLSSLNNINLSDNDLGGEIPEKLLQVAQYNYTGNHLNCSRQLTPCEKRTAKTGPKTKSNVWILVVVSSLLGIALCIIFCFGPIMFRSLSKGKQRVRDRSNVIVHRDVELVWETEGNNPDFTFFNYSQVLDATNDFLVENKLGQGGFGPVYKGRLPDGLEIAVKRLASHSMQGFREFRNEVQLIAKLQHRNLVRLLGYCSHGEEKMLVYEYLKNKSLDFFIFGLDGSMPWTRRMKIAVGAARGLAFLHDADTPVIYRDFKASNILLDEDYNTKLSDFGLAKDGPQGDATHVTTRVMGTNGYAAPEYIMTGHLTAKSDVYSFGVVLLELLTGRRSVDRARRPREQSLVDWARPYLRKPDKLYRVMDPAMECQYSCRGAERAAMVAYKCLSQNPKSRPTMREVVQSLEPVLDMDDYLQIGPFVFTVVVEDGDGKSNDGGEGKVVDGEKVDVTIETTVEEKKQHHMSHQDRHRQKFPNSAVHADVVLHYRDGGELGPHISALRRHRRTSSYVKERGA